MAGNKIKIHITKQMAECVTVDFSGFFLFIKKEVDLCEAEGSEHLGIGPSLLSRPLGEERKMHFSENILRIVLTILAESGSKARITVTNHMMMRKMLAFRNQKGFITLAS